MNADRNLLFGILAFQNNFIDRQALLAAFDRWTADKNKPLGDILVEMGQLDVRYRELLDGLVAAHLEQHGNDAEKSLAAISSVGLLRDELRAAVNDPDVEASMAHLSIDSAYVHAATTLSWTAGTPTSAGTRFRVLRTHKSGGLGDVYVAEDQELHREVALKEIQDRYADDAVSRSRFLLEAEVTGGLEHPGVVPVYGLGSYADGRPFYAMRFIKGDSLKDAIKAFHQAKTSGLDLTERTAQLRTLLGRFIDVCNAMEYAHSRGVLHRDLKPGNIMLGKYGETLVVDWGLAKVIGRSEAHAESDEKTLRPVSASGSAATQMGHRLGTLQYMSPEQAAGKWDELGPASDVYSLGATLYTLLAGKAPVSADDRMDMPGRVVKGEFPGPRTVDKDVPRALEAICLKAMAPKPADRYASPLALADDIERWRNDQPVSVCRDPFYRQTARWVRNHKGTASAAAAAVVVLVFAGVVGSALSRRANEQTRALAAAESVLTAGAEGVPYTLEYLRPIGHRALARLRQHLYNGQADPVQRLHAAYALADLGELPQDFLIDAVAHLPADECRNVVAALAHGKYTTLRELTRRVESSADTTEKTRYAIVAMHLGDPQLATEALAVRGDPTERTTLIDAYASWHGDLSEAAELLRTNENLPFRSGLCAAFGTIAPETLEPAERNQATNVLKELYTKDPDGGTHAAAGWALRQWKQDLPPIASTPHPPSDRRWFVNGQGMTMVEIAAGKFRMGTASENFGKEWPAHEVTLTKPFYVSDREVTVEQFQLFVDDTAAEKPQDLQEFLRTWKYFGPMPDCPAQTVSWFDAVLFCNWLSTREDRKPCYERTGEKETINMKQCDVWRCDFAVDGYRLPTEGEWEYASRAGSSADYCFGGGTALLRDYAWFINNSESHAWPVGKKLPNLFGIFDLHGNVEEWCWDWEDKYSAEAASDPTGPATGSVRVVRGGAYSDHPYMCRSAFRRSYFPNTRVYAGFRVCCGR